MKNLLSQPMFQLWRRPVQAGLWSGLIAFVGMLTTTIAFPDGVYEPTHVLLMSLSGGFAIAYHLTIGLFIRGSRFLVILITTLVWFCIGAALSRYSKSGKAALGWWITIYAICAILSFFTLFMAVF